MAIKKKIAKQSKIEIDLTGPEGNAYCVMGYAKRYAKQLGYTQDEVNMLIFEMMSGDYDNLINVFDTHFGDYVDLLM